MGTANILNSFDDVYLLPGEPASCLRHRYQAAIIENIINTSGASAYLTIVKCFAFMFKFSYCTVYPGKNSMR